jgi:hypothetical protein
MLKEKTRKKKVRVWTHGPEYISMYITVTEALAYLNIFQRGGYATDGHTLIKSFQISIL